MSSNAHDVYRSPKRLDVSPLLTWTTDGLGDNRRAKRMLWRWDGDGMLGVFVFLCVLFGRSF